MLLPAMRLIQAPTAASRARRCSPPVPGLSQQLVLSSLGRLCWPQASPGAWSIPGLKWMGGLCLRADEVSCLELQMAGPAPAVVPSLLFFQGSQSHRKPSVTAVPFLSQVSEQRLFVALVPVVCWAQALLRQPVALPR